MDQKYDMPVKLNSVNTTTDYEGDFMSTRLIMWDLTFTAKGYIWPPVQNGKIIRQTTVNLYIDVTDVGTVNECVPGVGNSCWSLASGL